MPLIPAFYHERDKEKYHNNSRCGPGTEVPASHRIAGTGNRPLCQVCAKLNSESK